MHRVHMQGWCTYIVYRGSEVTAEAKELNAKREMDTQHHTSELYMHWPP